MLRCPPTAAPATAAFAFGLVASAAPGCSLTTLDFLECRSDADCSVSVGADYLCSADGFCRTFPDAPRRCEGVIQIRMLAELSGPLADVGLPYFKGELDLIREINAQGGIRGCAIEVQAVDYAYDATTAREAYDQWVAAPGWSEVITVFGFGTPDTVDLSPELAQQQIVNISASYSGEIASPGALDIGVNVPAVSDNFQPISLSVPKVSPGYPYNFFAGTDYSTGGRVAMEFANKEGARKVAFFACDNDYCQGPLAAIKTHASAGLGLELGRELFVDLEWSRAEVETAVLEFFAQEVAQRDADPDYVVPDWIWVGNTTTTAAHIGAAVGLVREQMDLDVQVIVNNWGFDETVFSRCGGDCVDYFHGIMPFAAYGDDVPGMDALMATHDKWRDLDAAGWNSNPPDVDANGDPRRFENVRYVQGYVSVLLWQRAMEKLIDFEKPRDGKGLREVLESFEVLNTGGLTPPLSFSRADHRPQSTEKIYRVGEDGSLVNVPPDAAVPLQDEWLGW